MSKSVKAVLTDLERTRENLLALSDDIWLNIDHNDPKGLEEGVEFKRAYNDKLAEFDRLATELSKMVQDFTEVQLEEEEELEATPPSEAPSESRQRVIAALDGQAAHRLSEDFTYKRPHGFILRDAAFKNLVTWKGLYRRVCQVLLEMDPAPIRRWAATGKRHRKTAFFSVTPKPLRVPLLIAEGIYAESNLAANRIRDILCMLLAEYHIPESDLRIFLREDRDADDLFGETGGN